MGLEWTADVKINQHEYADILIEKNGKYYLIESKIWSRDKNERGLTGSINKVIDQAITHAEFWEGRSVSIHKIAVITNQFDTELFKKCINNSLQEKSEIIGEKNIKIYPLKQISTFINELLDL
jgi:hypothetical protein